MVRLASIHLAAAAEEEQEETPSQVQAVLEALEGSVGAQAVILLTSSTRSLAPLVEAHLVVELEEQDLRARVVVTISRRA